MSNRISPFGRSYSQESPKDQARVILGSAEGSLLNLEDGTAGESAIIQLKERLVELQDLVSKYMPEEW